MARFPRSVRFIIFARHYYMQNEAKDQFVALYTAESDAVFRYCVSRTSNREVAVDITQDTFIRFWNALLRNELQHDRILNERAFLFTIARNLVIDWYRKKKTVSLEMLTEEADDGRATSFQPSDATKDEIDRLGEARHLMGKIKEIDVIYQEAVYLRFVEDLKPQEIAERLGESPNVISVHINRGLKQLRKIAGYEA